MVERILPLSQRREKRPDQTTFPASFSFCGLSSSPKDTITLADAKTGVLITGQTGKGKTSVPGRLLAKAYLRAGLGSRVLCAKADEPGLRRNSIRAIGPF
jgi:hypothetical protein